MIALSAFADEISPDLDEQLRVLRHENIHYLELRSVWDTNVLDLTERQLVGVLQALKARGVGVSCIASSLGKVSVDFPFDEHMARFERALQIARACGTHFIRVFSFYPPDGERATPAWPSGYREEVLSRLRRMVARAREEGIILLHENEIAIYGDTIDRCVDLLRSVNEPHFRSVFDPANFIRCVQTPYPDAYEALLPWISYVHVKDAWLDGRLVPPGEGAARWPELLARLRADGYQGFLSIQPHLAGPGRFQGRSGADIFSYASQSFQRLLSDLDWQYS